MHPDRLELDRFDWKLYTETPALGNARAPVKERSMSRLVLLASLSVALLSAAAIILWSATNNTGSAVSSDGPASSPVPRLVVHTPGFSNPHDAVNADVLLQRIEFSDGSSIGAAQFVYPTEIRNMQYAGPIDRFRRQNGTNATIGPTGIAYIDDLDGDGQSVSAQDLGLFADQMKIVWGNNNLNNRILLQSQAGYSFVVGLRTRIWDSDWGRDDRPELFVFEDQGNSVMTIQALNDELVPVGTPLEIRAVDLVSMQPTKTWVGRWGQNGQPQSGTYEAKCCAIDLSRLGVTSTRYFKITTAVSGGGEASADLKILAVDTSPGPAAQTMTFD
jgi:hypothetical protein